MKRACILALAAITVLACETPRLAAAQGAKPDPSDLWAAQTEAKMTDEERFTLLHGYYAMPSRGFVPPKLPDLVLGAGYVPGIARLGIPSLRETDAGLGVTNPNHVRDGDTATALPSSLVLAGSFNPELARKAGEALGAEARAKGFNVLLAGGMNLTRDPRNGRNFEYMSEDPLLSGEIAGEMVKGIQSQNVISTVKHFSLNSNETNRHFADGVIDEAAHRESDLLAFQIAIERGQPGAVMCAYNKVNGNYSCGNDTLLNKTLKGAWGYPGWVMSDWGAVHDWDYALKGLDQQSGQQLDKEIWFDQSLKGALASGKLPHARLSDMVRRILRSMHAAGIVNPGPAPKLDPSVGEAVALETARQGIVLLKNEGVLPLSASAKSIAIIGGRAQTGVLSGGGSSQATPPGGWAATVPVGGEGSMKAWRSERWFPGAPVDELGKLTKTKIEYDPGAYAEDAEALARRSDIVIIFASRHELEGYDTPTLGLPYGQDELIARVAKANPNTIVVLETGNPVAMPWLGSVKAVVAAWYPGQKGAQAIAEILTGVTNPSGRLPITFPASLADTPRPQLPGFGTPPNTPTSITYVEGSDVGYRWYAKKGVAPLFGFGHGMSYTTFAYSDLKVSGGINITASFTLKNTGEREGADVPQLYLTDAAGTQRMRLLAFKRVTLKPGESARVDVAADPRLIGSFEKASGKWRIDAGVYKIALGRSATDLVLNTQTTLMKQSFGK